MSTLKVGEIKHENFTGTTQLKLDSSGRLLLGTTTEGHDNADDLTIATSGQTGITIRSASNQAGNIYFSDATSGAGESDGYISYTQSTNKMLFGVNQDLRMTIDSAGRFLLNMSSSITGGKFQVNNAFNTFFSASNDTQGCVLQLEKTRSTSPGSYTIVQDGDKLGELQFKGSNGSASVIGANIQAIVNGTPGSGNDLPTDLTFRLMPDGSGSTLERMRITSGGNVGIGTASPTAASSETTLNIYANEYPELHLTSSVTGTAAGDGSIFTLNNDGSTIIRNQENSYIRFDTNGSNERMRITSAGDLLMGTTSASAFDSFGSNTGGIILDNVDSANTLLLTTHDTSKCFFGVDANYSYIWNESNHPMRFATNNTERMRIGSGGRVDIGASIGTAHAGYFQVIHEGGGNLTNDCLSYFETNSNDWIMLFNSNEGGNNAHYHMYFMEEGTARGSIYGGHGQNITYNSGSDYRWKENIVDMTGAEGIEICKKLKPRKYNWIKNREGTGKVNTVDGFIAHEVAEAGVLGAVTGEKDAVNEDGSIDGQMLDYGQMTPVLAAGIKGLIAKIEVLETKVAALEAA